MSAQKNRCWIILLFLFLLSSCDLWEDILDDEVPPGWEPPIVYAAGESCWGPDNWIVFGYTPLHITDGDTIEVSDSSGFWLIKPDGTGLRFLIGKTPGGISFDSPSDWSTDGRWILANDLFGRIWMISADGDSVVQITEGGKRWFPSFSPDRNKIAFSIPDSNEIGPRGLRILDLETGVEKFVFPYGIDPDWSPDGSKLIFCGWVYENGQWIGGSLGSLVVVDTSGENPQMVHLYEEGHGIGSPSFSPNGSKIVFQKPYAWGGGVGQIWVVNSNGSNARKLTTKGGAWPSWSHDGSKIVYTRYSLSDPDQEGNGELYIMNADGSGERRLTFFNL